MNSGERRDAMSRKTPPCGVPRPAFTSVLIARATSSRGSSSGGRRPAAVVVVPAVGLLLGVGRLGAEHVGDVVEHEPLARRVAQHAAVAADALGDEQAPHAERPDHPGRVELDRLHVDQLRARPQGQRVAVAGRLPGVRRVLPRLAHAAGREHDGGRGERDELARTRGGRRRSRRSAPSASVSESEHLALHQDVDAERDDLLLERADHLEPGAVADVGEPGEAVPAEVALQDPPVGGAVEQRAPRLELVDPVRRLLGVELGHPVVVEHLAAAHRVAEVHLPVVLGVDVAHRGGHAALGHDGVRLAEQRLGHDHRAQAPSRRLDGRAQPGAAGADDEHVVVVVLESRGSAATP